MQLIVSSDDLRPLLDQVVADLLDRFGDPCRLAFTEAESAALLGQKPHVLRDARLRGEICGSKVGRGHVYTRAELLEFLNRRRERQEVQGR